MFWQRFHRKGRPDYLAKHYWWAYLWRFGVWFFDHQMIINAIQLGLVQEKLLKIAMMRFTDNTLPE